MDPFVEQLSALCREHVTRNKWVFVPSHALGHTLGERIALGGTNWLNLRFVTPLDVALRMGAPFLVERGLLGDSALDRARVEWLVTRVTAAADRFEQALWGDRDADIDSFRAALAREGRGGSHGDRV